MAAFATLADIEDVWRPLTDVEVSVARTLVEHASAMLRARFTTLDDRISAGDLNETLAALAVVQMVKRVMLNPEYARSMSRSIDDYTESITFAEESLLGELVITPAEVELIRPRTPVGTRSRNIRVKPGLW